MTKELRTTPIGFAGMGAARLRAGTVSGHRLLV
jgi:hypothetical protein